MEEFNSLVKIFNDKSYNTLAFHGNDETFFYRDKGYSELGYDEFYSRKDFYPSQEMVEDESYLGLNDYDFFHQSLNYLDASDEPFFSYFITVTSHTPFNFTPEDQLKKRFEDIDNTLVRDYFQSVNFVDRSLEMFFKGLEAKDLLDNTLVVIFSDHNADINKEDYTSNGLFESQQNIKSPEHIPMMILHPDLEPTVIETAGTTTDMGPTVLDLFGYEEKPEEFLGESLLKETQRPIYFLHELPQIFYKDQLFLRIPLNVENEYIFEPIAHIKDKKDESIQLSALQKDELDRIINYMQETMNKLIYQ
jgi:phosphoglycerol transferase MdoB-like AlkP superfamily enzyme